MKAYTRPNAKHLIDTIDEATGLTTICKETLDEVRQRFPDAILVDVDQWCEEKQREQLAPITAAQVVHSPGRHTSCGIAAASSSSSISVEAWISNMAASPPIKVYRNGEYVASCKYFEDAAALAGMTTGTIVKWMGTKTIWTEGKEKLLAADSWDEAANIMQQRVMEWNRAAYEKQQATRVTNTKEQQAMADRVEQLNKDKLPDVRW